VAKFIRLRDVKCTREPRDLMSAITGALVCYSVTGCSSVVHGRQRRLAK